MRYINAIIKLLTFPGGFLRCFWEQLYCKINEIPVENRKCFQFNEMAGHIEHEPMPTARKSIAFCLVSGLLVFFAGIIFAIPAVLNLFYLDIESQVLRLISYICLYFAIVMFTNIFPSVEDALMMWDKYKTLSKPAKIVLSPMVSVMYAGAYAESLGITLVTNILLAVLGLIL